jgi:type I restriction enzyme, S subunit
MFETVTLSSVCTIVKQSPPQFDGYKQYVATADLQKSNIISSTKVTYENRPSRADSTVNLGDVLFAKMAGTEKTLIAKREHQDMLFSTGFAILRPIPDTLDSAYLYHILRSEKFLLQKDRMSSGATQKAITNKALLKIKIALPPIKEQIRIAAIFDKADEILQTSLTTKVKRDEMIYSTFLNMFGDPAINTNNYPISKMKDLMEEGFQNGLYIPKEKYTDINGVEMVHMSDAFYDTVKRGSLKKAILNELEINKYNLSNDNLLITRRSLNYEGAAKSCRIPESNVPLVFESSLIRLNPNKKLINTTYLHFYINNKRVREAYIYKYVTKSTISGINQKNLSQIPVILPPIELQEKFAHYVNFLEKIPNSIKLATNNSLSITQELLT